MDNFKSTGAGKLCAQLVAMLGDPSATCSLVSAAANTRRRRALQQVGGPGGVLLGGRATPQASPEHGGHGC